MFDRFKWNQNGNGNHMSLISKAFIFHYCHYSYERDNMTQSDGTGYSKSKNIFNRENKKIIFCNQFTLIECHFSI